MNDGPARLLIALIALLCVACTGIAIAPRGARIDVALAPAPSPRTWIAEFTSARPVRAIRMVRNPDDSRRLSWRIGPAFEIARQDGADVIRRKDGASFRTVAASMPARYRVLPKDYAPFSPFTDSGLLIYTGQFHACAGSEKCPDAAQPRVTVSAPSGSHTLVSGEIRRRVTFQDSEDGTNIYVGSAVPLETEHYFAVIDAKLPEEVRGALSQLLPRMMQYFSTRLGPLERRPLLFASLDPDSPSGSGFNRQGGTLRDQIFMHLYGEDWASKAHEQEEGVLPWFFAHEAAHLFQFVKVTRENFDMDQSWIHEGGADALAALTVTRFGGATEAYVQGRIDAALRACAAGLEALGKPLNESFTAGAFGNYYVCGQVMQMAIHAEVNRSSAGTRDLFDVWALFLARVRAGQPWNQDTFLDAASELGASAAAEAARTLASTSQTDPEAFLRQLIGNNSPAL